MTNNADYCKSIIGRIAIQLDGLNKGIITDAVIIKQTIWISVSNGKALINDHLENWIIR